MGGHGVERCVWEQAAWSEWVTADGHAVATILYDLLESLESCGAPKADRRSSAHALSSEAAEVAAPSPARHVELDGVAG